MLGFNVLVGASLLLNALLCSGQQASTPQGKIEGIFLKSAVGRQFEAYLGVPYAKSPVDDLRFKSPVPFGQWSGVKSAKTPPPVCIQKSIFSGLDDLSESTGDEDCLFVNVYTPSSSKPKKYPVMFFIHGGGFHGGTGNPTHYEPDFLLDKDIVLVTVNYRLGPLGFATTEDVELPGNFGLKDQALALKWVQENIAAYGGNPDSVTIFGQSAGGASVHYHMLSPLSKGLFHRAIPMSGSSHCPWAISPPGVGAKRTKKLASLVGCPTEPSALLVECMRHIPASVLVDLMEEFTEWNFDPVVVFIPVIEPDGVEGAFLKSYPRHTQTTVPIMTGFTSEDGAIKTALLSLPDGLEKQLRELNDNFEVYGPLTLMYDDIEDSKEITNKIRKFYFGEKNISTEVVSKITDLYTDSWFAECTMSIFKTHKGPAYLYYFAHQSEYSGSYKILGSKEYLGVMHSDDMFYLFPRKGAVDRTKGLSDRDNKMVDEMVTLWTNFAIHGTPTPEVKGSKEEKTKSKTVKWSPVSQPNTNYYHIEGNKSKMDKNLLDKRMAFWNDLQTLIESARSKSHVKDEL